MPRRDGWHAALLLGLAAFTHPAAAQERVAVQALADVEGWSTHGGSPLLARNGDRPATLGRLQLWGAGQILRDLTLVSLVEAEAGKAADEGRAELYLSQLMLRYAPARWLVLDAGRFPTVAGGFAPRRMSTSNPLIGSPATYVPSYPWGAQFSGVANRFDYRAAVVDRSSGYVQEGGRSAHLVAGGGFSPVTGFRIGASLTHGTYLSEADARFLPPGADWRDYKQTAWGLDGAFSRGYLEVHGELVVSRYLVPDHAEALSGSSWYLEGKYTWGPRVFTALRMERSDVPYVKGAGPGDWDAVMTRVLDAEAGVGYRIDASTLVKVSYRQDRWTAAEEPGDPLPRGHAIAVQLSREFDITEWLSRPR